MITSSRAMDLFGGEVDALPLLSVEDERDLGRRARSGDEDAVHALVRGNLRFALIAARRWRGATPIEDAVQQACLGLLTAARKFDPNRGARFLTMAAPWVQQAITRYVLDDRAVRLPHSHQAERVLSAIRRDPEPTLERLCSASRMPEWYVASIWSAFSTETVREDMDTGEDVEANVGARLREDAIRRRVRRALGTLTPTERDIVVRRLLAEEPETLTAVAESYGRCREWTRKVQMRALTKLRAALEGADVLLEAA